MPGVYPTFARDFEYKRHGTLSLLAGTDLTGKVRALVKDRHRSREFIEFLKLLDAAYPPGTAIKLILDNHSAHISKGTKAWLDKQPAGRFEFTFTPKHASWLNLIEMGAYNEACWTNEGPYRTSSVYGLRTIVWRPSTGKFIHHPDDHNGLLDWQLYGPNDPEITQLVRACAREKFTAGRQPPPCSSRASFRQRRISVLAISARSTQRSGSTHTAVDTARRSNACAGRDHRNMAMRGDDVIGILQDAATERLLFLKTEAKSRLALTGQILTDARAALDKNGGLPFGHYHVRLPY